MSAKRQSIFRRRSRAKQACRCAAWASPRAVAPTRLVLGGLLFACLLSFFVAAPARAQTPGEIIGEAARAVGYQPSIPPAADFVERARPDLERLDYQPLAPADRANHRKSAKDLDKLANSLEGAKADSRRRAARVGATDQPAGRAPQTPAK